MLSRLQPIIYIQIAPDRLIVRHVRRGLNISEPPDLLISNEKKAVILAVGSNARTAAATSPHATLVNPFAHPRSLVSDFTSAEQLIKTFLRRALGQGLLTLAPLVIIHPLGNPEGGFTQVEIRAFLELALGAGAAKATVWQGRPLSDQEVLSRQFPAGGKVLA